MKKKLERSSLHPNPKCNIPISNIIRLLVLGKDNVCVLPLQKESLLNGPGYMTKMASGLALSAYTIYFQKLSEIETYCSTTLKTVFVR